MEWLSRNALFKERLQGEIPHINADTAKARLFARIGQVPDVAARPPVSALIPNARPLNR
jgi:hypothetical protein